MKKRNLFIVILLLVLSLAFCLTGCTQDKIKVKLMMDETSVYQEFEISEGSSIESKLESLTPTKTGYSFVNWVNEDGSDFVITEELYKDITLYAKWSAVKRYIVILPGYQGGQTIRIEVGSDNTYTLPEAPTRTGYEFTGYTYDDEEGNTVSFTLSGTYEGQGIRIKCNWEVAKYDVTFYDGETLLGDLSQEVSYNSKAVSPAAQSKTGYTFAGWFEKNENGELKETAFSFTESQITADLKLYAKYTANSYKISFKECGNQADLSVTYGEAYTLPVPTKNGYTFKGWTLYDEAFTKETTYNYDSNITLKATWEINKYSANFYVDGVVVESLKQTVEYGSKLTELEFKGYTVNGYYEESSFTNQIDLSTFVVTEDTNVYVKRTQNNYSIVVSNCTSLNKSNVHYNEAYDLGITLPYDTQSGRITGFLYNGKEFAVSGTFEFAEDITITAQFADKLYVSFAECTGFSAIEVSKGQTISAPKDANNNDPAKTGYTFIGWYLGETLFDFNTQINESITLTAKYTANSYKVKLGENEVSVTFDSQYDLKSNEAIKALVEAESFDKLVLKGTSTEFDVSGKYTSAQDVEVEVVSKKVTVTFMVGDDETESEIIYGTSVSAPTAPTKTGYTFTGWTLNDKAYSFETLVKSNITLIARFTANKYTVTIEGGTIDSKNTIEVTYGSTFTLSNPDTKEGYTFVKYYLSGDANQTALDFSVNAFELTGDSITFVILWNKEASEASSNVLTVDSLTVGDDTYTDIMVFATDVEYTLSSKVTAVAGVTSSFAGSETSTIKFSSTGICTLSLKKTDGSIYTRTIYVAQGVDSIAYGTDYSKNFGSGNDVETRFKTNDTFSKANYQAGVDNFVLDIECKMGTKEVEFNSTNFVVYYMESESRIDVAINSDGTLELSSLLGDNDTKVVTLVIEPKFNVLNKSIEVLVEFNNGVNVYTNDELFLAYRDHNVTKINILRNITAEMQFVNPITNLPFHQESVEGQSVLTISGVYYRQFISTGYFEEENNLVINGNYFTIDCSNIRLGYPDDSTKNAQGYVMPYDHVAIFRLTSIEYNRAEKVKTLGDVFPTNSDNATYQEYAAKLYAKADYHFENDYVDYDGNGECSTKNSITLNNIDMDGGVQLSDVTEPVSGTKKLLNADIVNGIYCNGGTYNLNGCLLHNLQCPIQYDANSAVYQDLTDMKATCVVNIDGCKIHDSWQLGIYIWSNGDLHLTNTEMYNLGGPCIVVDEKTVSTEQAFLSLQRHGNAGSLTESVLGTDDYASTVAALGHCKVFKDTEISIDAYTIANSTNWSTGEEIWYKMNTTPEAITQLKSQLPSICLNTENDVTKFAAIIYMQSASFSDNPERAWKFEKQLGSAGYGHMDLTITGCLNVLEYSSSTGASGYSNGSDANALSVKMIPALESTLDSPYGYIAYQQTLAGMQTQGHYIYENVELLVGVKSWQR